MFQFNGISIYRFQHDTVVLKDANQTILAFDPFNVQVVDFASIGDPQYIFITHDHFDHFSPKDIGLISNSSTCFVIPQGMVENFQKKVVTESSHITTVSPLEKHVIDCNDQKVTFMTLPAYNINKVSPKGIPYHPKDKKYVGYLLDFNSTAVYFAGDTDCIPELKLLKGKVDIAFLPISGTYVMDVAEAVECVGVFEPKVVIPIHYGAIMEDSDIAEEFKKEVEAKCPNIQVVLL